jgi:cytochrome P450 family 6
MELILAATIGVLQVSLNLKLFSIDKLYSFFDFYFVGKTHKSLSIEEIAANVFVFYIAGNESSSSTIAYTLYELTQNEELMKKAQEDVMNTLEKHDGILTYESIKDMRFIEFCVKETLRKYPGLPILNRVCTKNYHIPESSFTIKKGTSIIISLLGVHRDQKYFPNADKYDPERFSDDRHDYDDDMYMPFGQGPRNCIAFRMGILITKVAIIMLLRNYYFEAVTVEELEFDHGSVGLLPKSGKCKIRVLPK